MMKYLFKLTTLLLLLSLAVTTSCKKDSDDDATPTTDPIQVKLNAGKTPFEIYKEDNTNLEKLYGKTYQEGVIFYLDVTTGKGLVAAPTDQSSSANWGCVTTELVEITGEYHGSPPEWVEYDLPLSERQSLFGGKENTNEMIDKCPSSPAAKVCNDLVLGAYSDWYLPSLQEGVQFVKNIPTKNSYWTSTQRGNTQAWAVYGSDNTKTLILKSNHKNVRAVRQF